MVLIAQFYCTLEIQIKTAENSGLYLTVAVFERKWRRTYTLQGTPYITKTCLYNFDPLKPYFYIVKLGFIGDIDLHHSTLFGASVWLYPAGTLRWNNVDSTLIQPLVRWNNFASRWFNVVCLLGVLWFWHFMCISISTLTGYRNLFWTTSAPSVSRTLYSTWHAIDHRKQNEQMLA